MGEAACGIWAIIVHGGAKTIEAEAAEAHRIGCRAAVDAGAAVLRAGGTAIAAAQAAIRVLEDDTIFNAGRGSVLNADGEVEMDAAIMDGATLDIGAVAAVRELRHPIDAAVALLREPATLLVGPGAERFAAEHHLEQCQANELRAVAGNSSHDTVGCVALDQSGHFAAATSTGGLENTATGRVGDSPLPGCGFYAEDGLGAVSISGDGEAISRTLLAARIMRALEGGDAQAAAASFGAPLARVGGEAGAIVIDRTGCIGIAHNSEHFAVAAACSRRPEAEAGLHLNEVKHWIDYD